MEHTEQAVLRGRVLLTHQDTGMFFTVAWGRQHELATRGISNLQAAQEKTRMDVPGVQWSGYIPELGENVHRL